MTPWAQWLQQNFDKFLLAFLWIGAIFLILHMSHDAMDKDNISWGREIASGLMGALLGLITGARLAKHDQEKP